MTTQLKLILIAGIIFITGLSLWAGIPTEHDIKACMDNTVYNRAQCVTVLQR